MCGNIPESCTACEMALGKDILIKAISEGQINVTFSELKPGFGDILKTKSYRALEEIKSIIDDMSLDDAECFQKIEAIIQVFEDNGCFTERHDF